MTYDGCPEGMYPMDLTYEPEEYETFQELTEDAERASNILNLPISWWFQEDTEDEERRFTLVFIMPRKQNSTWGMTTTYFDRVEVQAWLDTWIPAQMAEWFGWESGR